MRKIEIIDCENTNHKITMMINDERMDFVDDVYCAISEHDGLSSRQIKKLESFIESCSGPIMVPCYYYDENMSIKLAYRKFDWSAVEVNRSNNNVYIHCTTRIQGHRPRVYKMSKDNYKDLDTALDEIHRMESFGGTSNKIMNRIWVGRRVY